MVQAARQPGGQPPASGAPLLNSQPPPAPELARAIRGHWGSGNSLHWVLDVARREDDGRVRTGHAAPNLATLRHLALNLLRRRPAGRFRKAPRSR